MWVMVIITIVSVFIAILCIIDRKKQTTVSPKELDKLQNQLKNLKAQLQLLKEAENNVQKKIYFNNANDAVKYLDDLLRKLRKPNDL